MAPRARARNAAVVCLCGAAGSAFVSTRQCAAQDASSVTATRPRADLGLNSMAQPSAPEGRLSAATALSPIAAAAVAGALALRRRSKNGRGIASKARGGSRGGEAMTLAPQDKWIGEIDLPAWGKEVHELGEKLKTEQGQEDQKHLTKMIWWSRICGIIGLSTMWQPAFSPLGIVSMFALGLWTHSAWTMIGHHVCHGGYNRTDPSGKYSSRGFAVGSLFQRALDWFDWMLPEAWGVEHNNLHHYRLGEDTDPDLLERNSATWEGTERYTMPFLSMILWKWAYYAPNTYKEMKIVEMRKNKIPLPEGFDPLAPITISEILQGKAKGVFTMWEFMKNVIGPYLLFRFFIIPAPLLLINPALYMNALANLALADIVSNIHGFIVIVTNHAGNDLYRFQTGCKPKSPTFYLRAVTSSANFKTGGNVNDFMHGWLNYQIEHHCWPDLSMLAYQRGQPDLKKICEKHGVPYVQESVWTRLNKTMKIAMGMTKMRVYPKELERKEDIMVWNDEKERLAAA